MVVASRALARDTVLAPGDVRLAESTSGSAPPGALHDVNLAVGQRLRRPADDGQALTASLLTSPTLVRRGQDVQVEALAGGLQVRMAGVARGDGALGDIIEVENETSGRVVQAVVRSGKSVEVLLR
jgi:flagella basal body P-ring formation protein FlgA